MGDEIETHEQKEDTHGEACKNLSPFETKGVPYGRTLPDFEVAENVNYHTDGGGYSIEEYEVGQCCEGQRSSSRVQNIHCYQNMTRTPGYSSGLFFRHACPCLSECRDGQRGGERKRCTWGWLEEDLMLCRNTAMFVSVPSAFANVLFTFVSAQKFCTNTKSKR